MNNVNLIKSGEHEMKIVIETMKTRTKNNG